MIISTSVRSEAGDTICYEVKDLTKETQLHYIPHRISDFGNEGYEYVERMKNVLNLVYKEKGIFEDLRKDGLGKGDFNRYVGSKVIGLNA
jgi:hypothetical protein